MVFPFTKQQRCSAIRWQSRFLDPDYSDDEFRFLTFGMSQSSRLLVVPMQTVTTACE
jgi:hypothetical protein